MKRRRRRGKIPTEAVLPLLALQAVMQYCCLKRKPPVTSGLIAANTLIYLRPGFLHRILPTMNQVLFNPYLILEDKDLKRFFLSAVYHIDKTHLGCNMLSTLRRGTRLENSMGSIEFASMIAALLGMSQGITLCLYKSLLHCFNYERGFYDTYAVGFSGVVFAMDVVCNSHSDIYINVCGIMVRARYVAWAELVLNQMFLPNSSFLGHLGGILAGLLYVRLKTWNPVTGIIRHATTVLNWPVSFVKSLFGFWRKGVSGRRITGPDGNDGPSNKAHKTFDSANQDREISLEELRRRRVEKFDRNRFDGE